MKFRDGYWQIKAGYHHLRAIELWEADVKNGELFLYAATKKVTHRGDTLNAAMLTTVFSSPMPDIIHVKTYHHKGGKPAIPEFNLASDKNDEVIILKASEENNLWSFAAGKLNAEVSAQGPYQLKFSYGKKKLTSDIGNISGYYTDSENKAFMTQYLRLGVGEMIYGLGERFTPFIKNGQVVDIWNEDGGTASEQAYKNIPFYISSAGYGVLINNPGKVSFEIASEVVSAAQFSVSGEVLDYYIIAGETLKDVIHNYTALSGRPTLPPAWSFGLWLSTSFTTTYNEETVNHFIDGMIERKIPLSVFHFDCFWMKGFHWIDLEWDTSQFPDPPAMLARLKKKGLKISMWINPYIAQNSSLFDEGMQKGFLVKKANGDIWQWDLWQAGMALIDFTNPLAAAWYQQKLKVLLDMGVDTFKTDFGERIPVNVQWHNGADSEKMHNYYAYLYNKTVFELLEETRGKNEAVVFARSATVGSQCFPLHWGGDCAASYESMAETLRGGLSLGLAGFGFWSHDISGFEQTPTPDLFKRWSAFGLLSSHSRLHGSGSYRVPWNFDEEACDVLRFFSELKCGLMPYLYRASLDAVNHGIPLLRSLILEFPDDPCCAYADCQFMLGENLLAAPIFNESGTVRYYLPEGRWTNILSGKVTEGGCWPTEQHDYFSLPLMARPNSIIAMGSNRSRPDYDYTDAIVFHLFELEAGKKALFEFCDSAGNIQGMIEVARSANTITVNMRGLKKPWTLCLRNIHNCNIVQGAQYKDSDKGLLISADGEGRIEIVL
jgi:alpha-D-xyloside xylohydrolase